MTAKKYLGLALLATVACSKRETVIVEPPSAELRPVAIEVEVYDPVTDFVWQNVAVRIVEAEVSGAGGVLPNAFADDWFFTDAAGLVYFDSFTMNDSQLGFLQDALGQAVLAAGEEARVVLELDALGFTALFVEVWLTWEQPQIFVSVPFN